ncbi:DNA cytosine methyltransferase [Kribbella jiaozuonensis]|uniref:DNA (cytosine-5-)-methyltransferase n=1 Tax=Kribbella jiaozuonensis TaxID=2575441 RepID=A0A4U3M526_9ACTN|nr:DNA cytosine methyltransferase [Kribbella jiaozuonensis]TKK79169.1 DNA cytosine methyltransferase [Kribbella jiaozuonensis]TKK83239.1 DNA cytosine methyltransferase [Kribbella jiaozuonensis]
MTLTLTDLFCGAGGSSTGAVQAPGVTVRIAANHWQLAVDVHNLNHPYADHSTADLHKENPGYFPRTDLLWASPECTKWTQANSNPLPAIEEGLFEDPLSSEAAQRSRLLMFDVLKFAEYHRYQVMIIENVVDIALRPKYRVAWQLWRQDLMKLGYQFRVISLNSMHAQAYGMPAPQSRDRIYIACWRKGSPAPDFEQILRPRAYCTKCDEVVESRQAWKPGRTVGRYRDQYVYVHAACGTIVEPAYLPAAAAIDWTIPGQLIGDRLQPKTRARIAAGIARYWGQAFHLEAAGNQYDAADPNHPRHGDPDAYYRAWAMNDVLRTLHTTASKALAVPVEGREGKQAQTVDLPFRTQTTRAETALVTPFVAELRGGGSDARSILEPAATFCASGNHHALVTPAGGSWNDDARPVTAPLRTLMTRDAYALVSPYYGNSHTARPATDPLGALTTVDRYALVHRNNTGGAEMTTSVNDYLRTFTTAGHQSLIQTGPRGGRPKSTPEDLKAAEQMVPECLFRMFTPGEVAAGMAFPTDYSFSVINPKTGRPPANRDLVKMCGNAVTPPAARDLITAVVTCLGHEPAA